MIDPEAIGVLKKIKLGGHDGKRGELFSFAYQLIGLWFYIIIFYIILTSRIHISNKIGDPRASSRACVIIKVIQSIAQEPY